jgi:hypothetical protein
VSQYLLSTYSVDGAVEGAPQSPEQMREFMQRIIELEADMDANGVFVFGGALHGPDASTVIRPARADVMMTDGPFVESKEHIGGFYIIEANDLDEALAWAKRVVEALGHSIEVRPFRATGRLKDQVPAN